MAKPKDELKEILLEMKERLSAIDTNTIVIASRLDALEPEVGNLAVVMTDVANQVLELHQRFIGLADRTARHFRRLELVGENGNGNGHYEEDQDPA